jgi:hypothetical protein
MTVVELPPSSFISNVTELCSKTYAEKKSDVLISTVVRKENTKEQMSKFWG